MRHPRHRRTALAATLLLAVGTAACGSGDTTASDPASSPAAPTTSADAPPGHPAFGVADYTYVLEVLCYCPLVGPVRIEVVDGAVARAVTTEGPDRGADAPDYVRLTIDDIIDRANEAGPDGAEVVWPDGQDHPSSVAVDQLPDAVDDEVTYLITDVQVSAG